MRTKTRAASGLTLLCSCAALAEPAEEESAPLTKEELEIYLNDLGAAALGDIGLLFPDNDPAYEGADSLALLRKVGGTLTNRGYYIENVDATVVCQAPKLRPYIEEMRENIALHLKVPKDRISVKATTEERLGFTGSGEGIAAQAVCAIAPLSGR